MVFFLVPFSKTFPGPPGKVSLSRLTWGTAFGGGDDSVVGGWGWARGRRSSLTDLDLRDNRVTSEGGRHLLKLLEANVSLTSVQVDGNPLRRIVARQVEVQADWNRRPGRPGSLPRVWVSLGQGFSQGPRTRGGGSRGLAEKGCWLDPHLVGPPQKSRIQ